MYRKSMYNETAILVCGGRDFMYPVALTNMLDMYHRLEGIPTLIHGGARGADSMAGRWAEKNDIPVNVYPAEWNKHGKSAGYIRNRQMLVEGNPDAVIAFSGGRGTDMMIRLALDNETPVWIVKIAPTSESLFHATCIWWGCNNTDNKLHNIPEMIAAARDYDISEQLTMCNKGAGGLSYNGIYI
jgi:hypothetical protein